MEMSVPTSSKILLASNMLLYVSTAMVISSLCHCGSSTRKDSWTDIENVENTEIDPVDPCVNDATVRLSSRVTSWSDADGRLRSRIISWNGKICKAGTDSALRRLCPGIDNPDASHGCRGYFRKEPFVQHKLGWMRRW